MIYYPVRRWICFSFSLVSIHFVFFYSLFFLRLIILMDYLGHFILVNIISDIWFDLLKKVNKSSFLFGFFQILAEFQFHQINNTINRIIIRKKSLDNNRYLLFCCCFCFLEIEKLNLLQVRIIFLTFFFQPFSF